MVDVVIPVYNEEADLARSVRRLDEFLARDFPMSARITIVDNASTDSTRAIAMRLAEELPRVEVLHLDEKGRGRALRAAWSTSDAQVLAYMDVDLSTDLRALHPLVAPLLSGHSDVAIGSRLLPSSKVRRGLKREVISRAYNAILHATLRTRFRDAQCGFKAIRADAAARLVPLVQDQEWFFDTELLVLAERSGMRIHEVAVDWADDPDSRVDIVQTAVADLRGVVRLHRSLAGGTVLRGLPRIVVARPPARPLVRFAGVGVLSTLAYVALYWLMRHTMPAAGANMLALLVTAVGNTAVNRRLTFGVRDGAGRMRDHLAGLTAFGVALAITTAAVGTLQHVDPSASRGLEVVVLVVANLAATLLRFLILRAVIGTPVTGPSAAGAGLVRAA